MIQPIERCIFFVFPSQNALSEFREILPDSYGEMFYRREKNIREYLLKLMGLDKVLLKFNDILFDKNTEEVLLRAKRSGQVYLSRFSLLQIFNDYFTLLYIIGTSICKYDSREIADDISLKWTLTA